MGLKWNAGLNAQIKAWSLVVAGLLHLNLVCARGAGFDGILQGQETNSTAWVGGPLNGWSELQLVPARVLLDGGPASNQVVYIEFNHTDSNGDRFGFEDLINFTPSTNVVIVSGPTLGAPPGVANWSYTMTVHLTDAQPGFVEFRARTAAGSHLFPGASLSISGTPSLGVLQISRPGAVPGNPDLAVVKSGPAQAVPGQVVSYTITYTNRSTATNAGTGVQVIDTLPTTNLVSYLPVGGGNVRVLGNLVTWDLGNLNPGQGGSLALSVRVNTNAPYGQSFQNVARIVSAENDISEADNESTVTTVIVFDRRPLATNDVYTVPEDTLLVIGPPGVLANDADPDGTPLTAVQVAGPTNGTLTFNNDGSFNYQPNTNFIGTDSFTYRALSGATNSDPAMVTITVTPANDPPVAVPDNYVINEDQVLSVLAPGVLTNDFDPDLTQLVAVLVASPNIGSLNLQADGSFLYTPNPNVFGSDTFQYQASDGITNSGPVTVTILINPVNDVPVANDDSYTVTLSQPLTVPASGVLLNDSDVDGDTLTAVLASGPANGLLSFNTNGSFTYTPNTNFSGTDTFQYRARDGLTSSAPATVTLRVNPTGVPPVASPDAFTLNEDQPLFIPASGILTNDTDPDSATLMAFLASSPTNGTLTLNLDGSFLYTPALNFNGTDRFTYYATDGTNNSGVVPVNLTILPVNDAPSFVRGPNLVIDSMSGPQTLGNWASAISKGPPDEASQTLTFDVSVSVSSLFLQMPALATNGTLTLTPSPGVSGTINVTLVLRDNGGVASGGMDVSPSVTFTITFTAPGVNAPPSVSLINPTNGSVFMINQDITLVADTQDVDGTVTNVTFFAGTTTLGQDPNAPFFLVWSNAPAGAYALTAVAVDDGGARATSAVVNITVIPGPPLLPAGTPVLNRQTGLFEQNVGITNPTPSTLTLVRIWVSNLPAGVSVFNAAGQSNGVPYVLFQGAILAGQVGYAVIEYYSTVNRTPPNPSLIADVPPEAPPLIPGGSPLAVDRILRLGNGSILVEFSSLSNRLYYVQYRSSLSLPWKTALPHVTGNGTRIQWIDQGPPKTDSHPATQSSRFYQILLLP